ncbi:MAG: hypothetical protein M0P10_10225, partial [Sphaerochaetaceae bacterium]|nr:hypothetical protein [Sphaerochaetaceae bacterium]
NRYVSAFLLGMQPAIAAIIADVTMTLGWNVIKKKEVLFIVIMALAFICNYILNVNVIAIILVCAIIGAIYAVYQEKKLEKLKEAE